MLTEFGGAGDLPEFEWPASPNTWIMKGKGERRGPPLRGKRWVTHSQDSWETGLSGAEDSWRGLQGVRVETQGWKYRWKATKPFWEAGKCHGKSTDLNEQILLRPYCILCLLWHWVKEVDPSGFSFLKHKWREAKRPKVLAEQNPEKLWAKEWHVEWRVQQNGPGVMHRNPIGGGHVEVCNISQSPEDGVLEWGAS